MDDVLSYVFAIILAIVITCVAPAYRVSYSTDQSINRIVNKQTENFTNSIRHKGFISKEMLETFLNELNKTNYLYNVEIIHSKKTYYPLDPTHPNYSPDNPFTIQDDKYPTKYILDVIYNQKKDYKMLEGDDIEITVVDKTVTSGMIFSKLMGGSGDSTIFAKFSGAVTFTDY